MIKTLFTRSPAVIGALLATAALCGAHALAKLPPLSEEAKAKAAEAAAKTAWSNKVADYQLCKSMDRVAARYASEATGQGKEVKPVETPACTDPGAFTYTAPDARPLEAAGAHSPAQTAATPPNSAAPAASPPAPPRTPDSPGGVQRGSERAAASAPTIAR